MRVRGDVSPSSAYRIEPQPGQPGMVCVRLFENPVHVEEESHWEYDEYQVIVRDSPGLAAAIENNFEAWMQTCRTREEIGRSTVYMELQDEIARYQASIVDYEFNICMEEIGNV